MRSLRMGDRIYMWSKAMKVLAIAVKNNRTEDRFSGLLARLRVGG